MEISAREWNEMKAKIVDIDKKVSILVNDAGKKLLTPKEVCEMLKIGRSTYQRYVEAGIVEQIHIGGNNSRVFIERSEIDRLIDEGKV